MLTHKMICWISLVFDLNLGGYSDQTGLCFLYMLSTISFGQSSAKRWKNRVVDTNDFIEGFLV